MARWLQQLAEALQYTFREVLVWGPIRTEADCALANEGWAAYVAGKRYDLEKPRQWRVGWINAELFADRWPS